MEKQMSSPRFAVATRDVQSFTFFFMIRRNCNPAYAVYTWSVAVEKRYAALLQAQWQ